VTEKIKKTGMSEHASFSGGRGDHREDGGGALRKGKEERNKGEKIPRREKEKKERCPHAPA